MSTEKITALEVALQELNTVAGVMHLSDEVMGYLKTPQHVYSVSIPVRMDNGSLRFFEGYRSQHNTALGPSRGGTRFHPDETQDDVVALSFWMTIKNSLAGIPSGGGKGGVRVDPSRLSHTELERLCRGYVRAVFPVIGPDVDVCGPDVGTPQQVMAWFMDEYSVLNHGHTPTAFSGKPPLLGGSLGRDKSTGYGLVAVTEKLLHLNNESLEGKKVAIQGFGNLGSFSAQAFARKGAKIIAISDVRGGIYNSKGIDVAAAFDQVAGTGSVVGLAGCDSLSNAELLAMDCDILTPCALQNQITEENAGAVRARYVVEGANGPTTPGGEAILLDRGITVMPGIVANFGGVLVSYFEQVQNRYCSAWTEDVVMAKLEASMTKCCADVSAVAADKKTSLRTAAWVLALDKVVNAMRLRGWVR